MSSRRRRRKLTTGKESRLWWLLLPVMIPVVILFVIVGLLFFLVTSPYWLLTDWLARRRERKFYAEYCSAQAGQVFLICLSCRGWHEFLHNNVLARLPEDTQLHWSPHPNPFRRYKRDHAPFHAGLLRVLWAAGVSEQRPFLVGVLAEGVCIEPLHKALYPIKAKQRKKDPQVQGQVQQLLTESAGALRDRMSRSEDVRRPDKFAGLPPDRMVRV